MFSIQFQFHCVASKPLELTEVVKREREGRRVIRKRNLGEANITLGKPNQGLEEVNQVLGDANITLGEANQTLGGIQILIQTCQILIYAFL